MLDNKIATISELVENTDISSSNLSKSLRNNNISEKYVRTIEESLNLPRLFFDQDKMLVTNKGYTLESYVNREVAFQINNVDVGEDCFYIQIIDDDFYKTGSLILFKPIQEKQILPNKIYLIKSKDKYFITKSRVVYLIDYRNNKFLAKDVEIIAEQIRLEF